MLGLSGRGERTYLRFLKYLETISPKEAQQRREMYEDSMGYKIHTAYVAARLAKELHKGQVDKAGKDYFEGHLATVGGSGYDWKQKAVGFLHDVAEDTSYSVKDIIRFLQKGLKVWKARPEEQDWNDLRHNMDISRFPNPTEKDYIRLERYQKEYEALMEMFRGACEIQYPTLVEDSDRLNEWEF